MNRAHVVLAFAALAALAASTGGPPAARAAGPTPTITSLDPVTGLTAGGTLVTITGTDFVAPMQVTFGGTPATSVSVVSPTQLTCTTPPHARGAVDVVVTQPVPPPSPSAPLVGGFTYVEAPARVWVPRAPGSETGGNPGGLDVTVVDWANREVVGSLDLNPGDADLPSDTSWRVSQVLFDGTGDHAFLATSGTPGTLDSQKIFIVRPARVLGAEAGPPVIATIDTDGNPYQLALSADGNTLYAADPGSWQGSATLLPDGTFRVYDVTDRAAPALQGTPTAVGILPVLAYDRSAYGGWGTNSSFSGRVQSKNSRCVITNAGSHTLSVVDVSTRNVIASADVGVPGGGPVQLTTSIPSPFSDDFVFVQTLDVLSDRTRYFVFRVSTAALDDRGDVATPIQFFPLLPVPDLSGRGAWAHPDGQSLVAIPSADASVASWNQATGSAANRTAIQGGGPPSSLGYNDAKGFFYAREADGGWTVFSVPATRSAAPVQVKQVPEATGADSLRVVGDGTFLVATATSALLIVDGSGANATAHEPVATVPLPLDPSGGPAFPQPGTGAGGPRTFVTPPAAAIGPRLVLPLAGSEYGPADGPPTFEIDPGTSFDAGDERLELELGTQYDFLVFPGARRVRLPVDGDDFLFDPPPGAWLRILRGTAGEVSRPVYARANRVDAFGSRTYGETLVLQVAAPLVPAPAGPADGAAATPAAPPTFLFDTAGSGRYGIEFAGPEGFDEGILGRFFAARDPAGPQASAPAPARAWRRSAEKAIRRSDLAQVPHAILWRVRFQDGFGRVILSPERTLALP